MAIHTVPVCHVDLVNHILCNLDTFKVLFYLVFSKFVAFQMSLVLVMVLIRVYIFSLNDTGTFLQYFLI